MEVDTVSTDNSFKQCCKWKTNKVLPGKGISAK